MTTCIFPTERIGNTSLHGYIHANFDELVNLFGWPHYFEPRNGNKVQCEWGFEAEDGTVFTIYDWKEYETHPSDISKWHIGGHSVSALLLIKDLIPEGSPMSVSYYVGY
jgi:hypothetical protein